LFRILQTYLLRELARKLPHDCSEITDIANIVEFVGISFNSATPIGQDDIYLKIVGYEHVNYLPVLTRIYFCLFTKRTLKWEFFTHLLNEYFSLGSNNVKKFRTELESLVETRFRNASDIDNAENVTQTVSMEKKLVLLFDEITKIDVCTEYKIKTTEKPLSEQVRAYTCMKADQNEVFSLCLMSVLNIEVVDLAAKIATDSGRLCVSVGQLTQLNEDQCSLLFNKILPKLEFSSVLGGKQRSVTKEYILRDLYYLSGGHPRTIDLLITQISQSSSRVTLNHCIVEIISKQNERFRAPEWDVMQAVLLAKEVTAKDLLPGLSRRYDIAIAKGELIGSLTSSASTFKPQIPEILMHKWARVNISSEDKTKREIATALMEIFNIRFNFTSVSLEHVLLYHEYIMSRLYCSPGLQEYYSRISMRNLLPLARSNEIDDAIDIEINAAKPLSYVNSNKDDSLPCSKYNCLFKPDDPSNTGFDFRIRFSLAGRSKRFIDVFYQVKFSEDDSSNSLSSKELLEDFSNCQKVVHPQAVGFVFVFMSWRPGGQLMEIPAGSLLMHKKILRDTLGPFFANFIETLTTRPVMMESSSSASSSSLA
jgi:hypothetical protein